MKVIFLDIDGVLNYQRHFVRRKDKEDDIDETKVVLLKEIVDKTGAIIVLSSSLRKLRVKSEKEKANPTFEKFVETLSKFGLTIVDYTPSLSGDTQRGDEIREWLQGNEVESFVILDDSSDMCEYTETNLVQTSFYKEGLEREHIEKAIKLLNNKRSK